MLNKTKVYLPQFSCFWCKTCSSVSKKKNVRKSLYIKLSSSFFNQFNADYCLKYLLNRSLHTDILFNNPQMSPSPCLFPISLSVCFYSGYQSFWQQRILYVVIFCFHFYHVYLIHGYIGYWRWKFAVFHCLPTEILSDW